MTAAGILAPSDGTEASERRPRTWYVLHVKPRTEKKVFEFLGPLGVFRHLPLREKVKKVQRRKVVRRLPLFPGYVFTRLGPDERRRVLGTRQIVRTIEVTEPRKMIHQLRQIERVRRLPNDLRPIEAFHPGECVRVKSGPLAGIEGYVKREGRETSLVLVVDILGRALEAAVDPADLEKA